MDGRVLDTPWPIRFCVVHFAILPKRPAESAHAYSKIWTPDGSPLVVISRNVQRLLQQRLSIPVELAMRYQNPSIDCRGEDACGARRGRDIPDSALPPLCDVELRDRGRARAGVGVAARAGDAACTSNSRITTIRDYIDALVASCARASRGGYDHLLFSFHGIPERHLRKADPTRRHCLQSANCCEMPSEAHQFCYRAQCLKTMRDFVAKAGVPAEQVLVRLPITPRQRPVAEALHRFGTGALRPGRREEDARDVSRLRLRLPRNDRGDRHARPRQLRPVRRRTAAAHSLHERAPALDRRAGELRDAPLAGCGGADRLSTGRRSRVISPTKGRLLPARRLPMSLYRNNRRRRRSRLGHRGIHASRFTWSSGINTTVAVRAHGPIHRRIQRTDRAVPGAYSEQSFCS